MTNAIKVHPKQGIALRLPERPYTNDLEHCLAPILYSPETGIVAMAHVYDTFGPARYSAQKVIDSLIEDMIAVDSRVSSYPLRASLVGELALSLGMTTSRTSKVTASLQERKIPIMHKVLGGQLWKRVSVLESGQLFVEEYRQDCVQPLYGELPAEKEHWLVL